ncbi:ABC transporter permease [Azospirillum rugosum]|uniref:Spermidine/putrescine transport system permease protein n=1 Tax=Azospirillum rugosum TaxID=416170 RepID=A0ABS4SUG1_9PROT|nr:ABC transporter permease [Azospirillum rugosum]MBP2296191.1 putative spermidine/putrescine transport system permease protein [Azospirillum rugosum]MDQ0527124.1 putative spermidine/putrescine transport system permease protein [Azospirillum rugosum]
MVASTADTVAPAKPLAGLEWTLALPLTAFFAVFFVTPLLLLVVVSLFADSEMTRFGLDQYAKFFGDAFNWKVLGSTLFLGVKVTVLTLLFGYPLAWLYTRSGPRMQSALILVVILPLLTSVVVRTFAWVVILGRDGIVNNLLLTLGLAETPLRLLYTENGLVAALVQVQMPLMVLPLITTLTRLDPNLLDASSALGAGPWRTFFKVTLPLSLPGIVAGCLLTYAASVTAFITQSLVGGGQLLFMPQYIYQQTITLHNWPFAAAISMVFMVSVLGVVMLLNLLGRASKGYIHA